MTVFTTVTFAQALANASFHSFLFFELCFASFARYILNNSLGDCYLDGSFRLTNVKID